jgi:hypothetical protein
MVYKPFVQMVILEARNVNTLDYESLSQELLEPHHQFTLVELQEDP